MRNPALATRDDTAATPAPPPVKLPTSTEPQRSQKAPKPPKPRKVEKRQRGRKG
jgi:hypothetical protein